MPAYAIWWIFLAGTLAAPLQHRQASPKYTGIVAFGDSYTDSGNEFRLSNQTWPADPAYYQGRFSNGPTWVEDVAANLSVPLQNFAFAGATTSNALVQGYSGNEGSLPVPSIDEQLSRYLNSQPKSLDSVLFAILGGANDILLDPNITAVQSVGVIAGVVTTLRNQGARHFLFLNYPDLSTVPYNSYIPLPTQLQLGTYSSELNTGLEALASGITASGASPTAPTSTPSVSVTYVNLIPTFDAFGYYEGGWKNAGFDQFGLYGSCLVGAYVEVPQRTLCSNPDQHVWWDEFHPTRVSHRIISESVISALDA